MTSTRDPAVLDGAVRRLLARHLPDRRATSVDLLGAGEDNAAFDVDGELVVRCSTHPDPQERARRVLREARLLTAVASRSPLPVPVPALTVAEDGCLAYARLPGRPLLDLTAEQRGRHATTVGAALGGLLAALTALPAEDVAGLVDVDDTPPGVWLDECRASLTQLTPAIPERHLPAVQAFLAADPPGPADHLAFTHDDLGIEHVLVDPDTGRVTGVLDWTDAAITDPARDLGRVLRDLGPRALAAALAAYGAPRGDGRGLRQRIGFHARCGLLEDLAFGLDTGRPAYVDKSLLGMARLFPA
ncbi:phosphotransferase family protein [Geodermatophilus sp. SYSU D00742]